MMTNEFMKVYRLKITTYSPVHIGDSRDLEPTEYVICDGAAEAPAAKEVPAFVICPECNAKNPVNARYCGVCDTPLPQIKPTTHHQPAPQNDAFLYTFTPKQLSKALKSKNEDKWRTFCNAAKSGLDKVQNFLKNNAEIIAQTGYKRARVIDRPQREAIARHISNELTQQAYIPGSSIKGALELVLGDFAKKLRIADAISNKRFLTEIRQCFHSDEAMRNKKIYAEVVPAGTVFESEIRFKPEENENTLGWIQSECERFRKKRKDNIDVYTTENSFLIRLGKYCGKAYKTTDSAKITKWSTDKMPFGWCVVEFEEVK